MATLIQWMFARQVLVLPAALDQAAEMPKRGESLLAQPLELGFGGALEPLTAAHHMMI
ncbi:hypothetical protein ACSS6W_007161 [Trichoderma asperelloides]